MSFAKSFYADQKKTEQPQQPQDFAASPSIPATTPIAEEALTPAQIQDAIRLYRSVLTSSSAPSSPARRTAPAAPERPQVHSNYYGGGPTDIPQSYLLNYNTSPARVAPVSAPATQVPEQLFSEQKLVQQLQALQVQQQQQQVAPEPVYEAPPVQQKVVPKKAPVLQKMYDDEESGYCFARNTREKEEVQEISQEIPEEHVATPTSAPQVNYSVPVNYSRAQVSNNYSKAVSGPSEYIGMSNDCRFIYDTQKAPNSYAQNNSYTLINAAPVAPIISQEVEEHSTTFDATQVPESPAVTSRFRGLIRNAQTPVQATAPIVVERVSEAASQVNYNNYSAFMPVNQISMESEYQLPVLNDLASCIEHY